MFKINLLLIAIALSPLPASATLSWNFAGSGNNYGSQHTFTGSSGAGNVTVYAYSTTNDSTTDPTNPSGASTLNDPNNTYIDRFATGTLGAWSGGIGVQSAEDGTFGSSPHHAFDNDGGNGNDSETPDEAPDGDVDAALFQFDQSVTLTNISLGWSQYDSDLSILAYIPTNADPTVPTILDKTFSDLLASGWQLVGNYADVAPGGSGSAAISTAVSSSYWLVSAFTTCANATRADSTCTAGPSANGGSLDFGNDYFKISSLTGNFSTTSGGNNGVPEPSIYLLLSIGLLGWRMNSNRVARDSLAA